HRTEATATYRLNAANEVIFQWRPEQWEPTVSDPAIAERAAIPAAPTSVPVPVVAASSSAPAASSSAPIAAGSSSSSVFQQGAADRQAYESWFASLTGDYRMGAFFWAGQRSLPKPQSCAALGGEATAGCLAAQQHLAPSDMRRKTEPEYRQGW